jgi:hypothetical protein
MTKYSIAKFINALFLVSYRCNVHGQLRPHLFATFWSAAAGRRNSILPSLPPAPRLRRPLHAPRPLLYPRSWRRIPSPADRRRGKLAVHAHAGDSQVLTWDTWCIVSRTPGRGVADTYVLCCGLGGFNFILFLEFQSVLWIRIHFLRIRIRIRIQILPLETNTDPDSGSGSGSRSNTDPGL